MFIPGRIEVLGKHTDYCGGRSIVCAIDRGFHASVEPRTDALLVLENEDSGESVSFDLADPQTASGHWTNYAIEVARRVSANFKERPLLGTSIRFGSDLPKAAGLSSSSALMIMIFSALDAVNNLRGTETFQKNIADELELAEYLGCVENGQSFRGLAGSTGVGTFGGSQDHAAILLGRKETLTRFSFSPMKREADFEFRSDHTFVVASSGISAEKTGAAREKYNRVSSMVSVITATIGKEMSLAQILAEIGMDELRKLIKKGQFEFSTDELLDRIEQFQVESFEIIPAVGELLAGGEIGEVGELIDRSQQNAERLLGNQIEETIFLQRSAREIGSIAASAFGAGFGGSVYAIVRTSDAENFGKEWQRAYENKFPQHSHASEFFKTRPSQILLA